MEITIKEAVEAYLNLGKLIAEDKKNRYILSSSVRIRLAGNIRRLTPIVAEYEKERDALVKKLGEEIRVGDRTQFSVLESSNNRAEFESEINGMLKEKSEVDIKQIEAWELAGVSQSTYENPSSDISKQNQVEIDFITSLIGCGILKT